MRQGNGSDLLGANDPRSATIGVIYVAPNDDRESVLAAILTQEKLRRKQIAIVLPTQNKAFQRPVDFDGLKNMRRKLQAQLVIIASHGSSPAEFARQRHFALHNSLENYGESLREENEASRASRRGRWSLFSARQPKAQATGEHVTKDSEQIPTSPLPAASQNHIQQSSNNVDEQRHEQHTGPGVDAAALGLGAGAVAADHFMHTPGNNGVSQPPLTQHPDASDDDLALASPPPSDSPAANGIPARDEIKPLPANQKPVEDSAPGIITFPLSPRPRNLNNQPVSSNKAEFEEKPAPVQPVPVIVPLTAPNGRRDSGKMAAVSAGSAAGGAVPATGIPGSGGGPPTRGNGGNGGGQPSGQPRRSGLRWLPLALVALLVLSLLLCAITALAAPGVVPAPLKNIFSGVTGGGAPSATVTITPKSADLHNTYVITGVTTGTPDSSKRQVQARILTPVAETASKTVAATGVLNIPATQATGTLTFYNGNGIDEVVKASSFVLTVNGVQIRLTADVDIPASPAAGVFGVKNAAAFANPPGASGNIPVGTINQFCCGNSAVSVKNNTAFSGGKNASTETIVQQSDINNAATPLENSLKQAALASSNFKKQAGEQFLPNQPQCNTSVFSNPAIGQQSQSVTVTVKVTCTGEVYDQSAAQALAANLLKSEATKATGPGYTLVGNIVTTVTQASAGGTGGTVTLFVKAQGIWAYQFTAAQKAQLAQLIAGKTQNDANTLLSQQAGVAKVNSITLSSGTKLPTDPKQITIVVENVPGLQGTPTGGPGAGTPTFTTSPVPRPSPSVVPGK